MAMVVCASMSKQIDLYAHHLPPRQNTKNRGGSQKTYNSRCSLVVTDPTTNLPLTSLSMGERTGSRILLWLWSYVLD